MAQKMNELRAYHFHQHTHMIKSDETAVLKYITSTEKGVKRQGRKSDTEKL